ncbi:protein spitz-like isoform X2 [Tachypleus tridentatus]|uniref:protein spitz-like isoform X2 n=1 Tax=Tachypleus tridentatus TaxID=6853 RepID=UPI003FD10E8A
MVKTWCLFSDYYLAGYQIQTPATHWKSCRPLFIPDSSNKSSNSPQKAAFRPSSTMYPPLLLLLLFISAVFRIAEACSSRSTPKPRPPTTTMRPNITFQTYACPETYAKWYCLNGATCFSVKIGESILYNCECADGYMGQRCEFKDLDGSYAIKERGVIIERASIAGGLTIVVLFLVVSLCVCLYLRQRKKDVKESYDSSVDSERKPFSSPVSDRRKPPQDSVPSDVESGESGPSNVRSSELSTSP